MEFEWDAEKARINRLKHRVSFERATGVWSDPLHLIIPDRVVDGEERWWAIGLVEPGGVLVVVHLYPDPDDDNLVRVISARKAERHERKQYEDGSI
ncbi:MAG: BrnT family toxin [Caulobacteraceae bacterium]|nr:MAG: BrnT family toxin [Caulobacteraceae bacterium]